MPRLDALPGPYAIRLEAALDATAWASRCRSDHEAQWIAWNVREDAWYRDAEVQRIVTVIDCVDASLCGPALLTRCAAQLQRARLMDPAELARLPVLGVNHIAATRFSRRYELAPESAWAEGSVPGEIDPVLASGTRLRVVLRAGGARFAWLTFEACGKIVSRDPDEVMRFLGLGWSSSGGTVVRIEVPIDTLRANAAVFALPTLFDSLDDDPTRKLLPDWRARPTAEHRPDEPWGYARDMHLDGAGLPEIIAEIRSVTIMDAETLGSPRHDWGERPYLRGGRPK